MNIQSIMIPTTVAPAGEVEMRVSMPIPVINGYIKKAATKSIHGHEMSNTL